MRWMPSFHHVHVKQLISHKNFSVILFLQWWMFFFSDESWFTQTYAAAGWPTRASPKNVNFSLFFLLQTPTNRNMPAYTWSRYRGWEVWGGRKEHASCALLAGECEVGVSLISNAPWETGSCLPGCHFPICVFHFSLSGPIWTVDAAATAGFRHRDTIYTYTYHRSGGTTSTLPLLSGMVLC